MTAITMPQVDTHGSRGDFALLETIAVTNTGALTRYRYFTPPPQTVAMTLVLDVTITGTTPLMDFQLYGVNVAKDAAALTSPDDTNLFLIGAGWGAGITQLTTDTSSPAVTIHVSPYAPIDVTGSATADSVYSVNCFMPSVMAYKYILDGGTGDEDYNGTISAYWHRYPK